MSLLSAQVMRRLYDTESNMVVVSMLRVSMDTLTEMGSDRSDTGGELNMIFIFPENGGT